MSDPKIPLSEARAWLRGERSMTNTIPVEPFETWQARCAQADAAMCERAYWILRAAKEFPELHEQDDDQEPPAAVYTFDIEDDGEDAAGLFPYSNRVRVTVDHDPGGESSGRDSFAEYLVECFSKWFDGARVEMPAIDDEEAGA